MVEWECLAWEVLLVLVVDLAEVASVEADLEMMIQMTRCQISSTSMHT